MEIASIFVDNLNLGGYQRLALDQAYFLSDRGFEVSVNVLSDPSGWNLAELERDLLLEKFIKVNQLPSSRIRLARAIYGQYRSIQNPLIISHSLRSTFILKLIRPLVSTNYVINTTLHQLPGLTDTFQRIKRFIYAQFTDRLFCFSVGVKQAWENQFHVSFSPIVRKLTKEIQVLRNGIYLERLPNVAVVDHPNRNPRIVFLGRLAFWKGLSTMSRLSAETRLSRFDFMFMIPSSDSRSLSSLTELLGERAIVQTGKTISNYEPIPGDVHIYPANFGTGIKIVESISLNCLEMGSIGVPSLVPKGGMFTWPEFANSTLYVEVNWADIASVINQIEITSFSAIQTSEVQRVRQLSSIENQIDFLIEQSR